MERLIQVESKGSEGLGLDRRGKVKKFKIGKLILDFDLYPRNDVDSQHVTSIIAALNAGAHMPEIIIDEKSKRIVDGFHRYRAYQRLYGDDYEVMCVCKRYRSEADIFTDAVEFNASHGRSLTMHDRTHCMIRAKELHIDPAVIASALNMTVAAVGKLETERTAQVLKVAGSRSAVVPLKRPIKHMGGKTVTKNQAAIIPKLGGNTASWYVNQLLMLLENDLIDWSDSRTITDLKHLKTTLTHALKNAPH